MQYAQDYDEVFPLGFDGSQWLNGQWCQLVQPYVKNLGVFVCPSDGLGAQRAPIGDQWPGWAGVTISYAANGLYSTQYDWFGDGNPNNGFRQIGVMATSNFPGWLSPSSASMASINRPAESILIAEKHSADSKFMWQVSSGGGPNATISGPYGDAGGWGDHKIPDGTRPAAAYPDGPNGAVSAKHAEMAAFLFCDGHVKAMHPTKTNPNPAANPELNLWDVTRP
jgi:prepilin-type processing-associated H-X9-DG protein